MDPGLRYVLSDRAAVRRERFGGLIYRHDNRRLYFVHSREVVDLLGCLDGSASLDESLDRFLETRRLPPTARPALLGALARLHAEEVLREL
jgi:putative mycofactocin binding protein MftB